jgi:hypothetical protein
MSSRLLASTISVIALCATAALAQSPPAAPFAMPPADKAEMQKHHAEMCSDIYALQVGDVAFLEARLAPNDRQKRPFERWKAVKLVQAKARAADCAAMTPPAEPPSAIDRLKMEEKMLKSRIDELRAEIPALEALFSALTDEQKRAFRGGGEPPFPMGPEGRRHPPVSPHCECMGGPDAPDHDPPPLPSQ